jgi:hypothetical protein
MGATALRATFRSSRILQRMTEDEAEGLNLQDPQRYIRIASSKQNYAPQPDQATWFKLIGIKLGNATEDYPDGDDIGVAVPWTPPSVWKNQTTADLNTVLDSIRDGPSPGMLYSKGKSDRWAGSVIMDQLALSEKQAKQMMVAWLKSGLLFEDTFTHPQWRRDVSGVRVNEGKRPT